MIVGLNIQKLLYGAVVATGVAITGALWWGRSDDGGRAKVRDYIDMSMSCVEKTMATEFFDITWTTTNAYNTEEIYTNTFLKWQVDPSGRGYYTHDETGARVWTNYLSTNGIEEIVVTNFWHATYRKELPNFGGELTGSSNRYIWNAYTNISISGLPVAAANGSYSFVTNGLLGRPHSAPLYTNDPVGHLLSAQWGSLGNTDFTTVYSNNANPTYFLFDLGPRDSLGDVGDLPHFPVDGTWSVVIVPSSGLHTPAYFTGRGDSIFNGPVIQYYSGFTTAVPAVVTAIGTFTTNIMRDSLCRWYVNKQRYTSLDPRYEMRGVQTIAPEVRKPALDAIEYFLSYTGPVELPIIFSLFDTAGYVSTNTAVNGEFLNISNDAQWAALIYSNNWGIACTNAGVAVAYTNHPVPTTQDVARLALVLRQMQWTLNQQATALDPIVRYGEGISTVSWADAKSIAETNIIAGYYGAPAGMLTWGQYYEYTDSPGYEHWEAYFMVTEQPLVYLGANTNIAHTSDFYLYAGDPRVTTNFSSDANAVFDANGYPVVRSNYVRIASVGPTTIPFPLTNFGTTNYIPNWCGDPKEVKILANVGGDFEEWLGWRSQGFVFGLWNEYGFLNSPKTIMKWDWQYNNP